MTNNTREALRAKIREAMTCEDREHLDSEDYEACYNCQIDKVLAVFDTATKELVIEALDQYPWHKIQKHGVSRMGIVDLDAYPNGNTLIQKEVYCLPKKWVDEMAALQSPKLDKEQS